MRNKIFGGNFEVFSSYGKIFIPLFSHKPRIFKKLFNRKKKILTKMSFNFDQFNNSSVTQRESHSRNAEETQIVPSGYVQIKKNEKDIFQKSKMNINLPANINFLCIANDWLVILMSNQLLFRLNLKQPDKQSEVFLEKFIAGQRVSKMFLDPTGTHLLISLTSKTSGYSNELMYLNKNNNKPKMISKVTTI
jgi:vacuolar protein sorting-associated protein 18